MEFQNAHNHLTQSIIREGRLAQSPFELVDVGCSGGIADLWRVFEPNLVAVGIDPVVVECQRLNTVEENSAIRYLSAFVGLPPEHPFSQETQGRSPTERNPWNRLSAAEATNILAERTKAEAKLPVLNTWQSESLADEVSLLGVDELVARESLTSVDFIKIDIDGNDMSALLSAENTIRNSPVLGLALEVNFYGGIGPHEHTFHNTDRLMRSWGFDLFGITSRSYSNRALPARFQYECPAQTLSGRPYQGDALYLRDAVGLENNPEYPELSTEKLLKLICLFEVFSLPGLAAELLLKHGPNLPLQKDAALDLLARSVRNDGRNYREHMERFQNDPTHFYPNGPM